MVRCHWPHEPDRARCQVVQRLSSSNERTGLSAPIVISPPPAERTSLPARRWDEPPTSFYQKVDDGELRRLPIILLVVYRRKD